MSKKAKLFYLYIVLLGTILHSSVWATTTVQSDSNASCCSGCARSQNLWQPHAFSVSMSREVILEKPAWINTTDVEGWNGTFGVGFEFMKNWGENCKCEPKHCCTSLGSMPFWASNKTNQMTVGDNSGDYDLDAYQMGMGPVTTNGTVRLDPSVYQTGGAFLLYIGSHRTERGFFVKFHAPVGLTGVNPRISDAGDLISTTYAANEISSEQAAPLYENIKKAFAGGVAAGDLRAMQFGRIDCQRTSSVKFGDLEFSIGYNLYADEVKHLGLAVRFSAPTGNKANGIYVLEPIFGRNGHWAAGGELMSHWRIWEADRDDCYIDLWFDGVLEHLFNSNHIRSFDLKKNGFGSKYLLAAKYTGTPGVYQNEISNVINLTTLPVESTFAVEGNFALMFDTHIRNWSVGFGYEGWGRSCESLKMDCSCPGNINLSDWAILGRQQIAHTVSSTTVALCEPTAMIGKSQDATDVATATIVTATDIKNRIPQDLSQAIDIDAQRAHAAYTSKAFAQIAYTFKDSDYCPYLSLSGSGEFNHFYNNAVNFWSVGLQGGLSF
ncbi:hypothetical protein HYV11_01865 [Candidatus Dependentiae bacterium]|nr:hypothetical protein [Candidatus Dependentiae bacterium]